MAAQESRAKHLTVVFFTVALGVIGVAVVALSTQSMLDISLSASLFMGVLLLESMWDNWTRTNHLEMNIEKKLSPAEIRPVTRSDMYKEVATLTKNAERRLLIMQRTPTPIFPPERSDKDYKAERGFSTEYNRKIEKTRTGGKGPEILYITSLYDPAFEKKVEQIPPDKLDKFTARCNDFVSHAELPDTVTQFALGPSYLVNPLLLSDDIIALWLIESTTGSERIYLKVHHEDTAKAIFDRYRLIAGSFDEAKFKEELDELVNRVRMKRKR
jgi:hypothetical protein